MPERHGYKIDGGWASGTDNINGNSIPQQITADNRTDNTPAEYKASNFIEFVDGFVSGASDEFFAYIATASNIAAGNTIGSGGEFNVYRYGFNGKENDNEVKGEGNQQDYGMRIYDGRLGRFLSVDPFSKQFQASTPYSFAGNMPISMIDFEGGFRFSPYFLKKYPTLAKFLSSMVTRLKSDTKTRDNWIYKMGIKNQKIGQQMWDNMLTYGSGPWVTPDRPMSEMRDIALNDFFDNGNKGEFVNAFPDNIIINRHELESIEAALQKSDGKEASFQIFKAFVLIMHESGHWARYNAGLKDRSDFCYEDGAMSEEGIFGQRFNYTNCFKADLSSQSFNNDRARSFFNKNYENSATNKGILIPGLPFCLEIDKLKKMPSPKGHNGNPAVIQNKDEKKPRVYQQNTEPKKSSGNYSY